MLFTQLENFASKKDFPYYKGMTETKGGVMLTIWVTY